MNTTVSLYLLRQQSVQQSANNKSVIIACHNNPMKYLQEKYISLTGAMTGTIYGPYYWPCSRLYTESKNQYPENIKKCLESQIL